METATTETGVPPMAASLPFRTGCVIIESLHFSHCKISILCFSTTGDLMSDQSWAGCFRDRRAVARWVMVALVIGADVERLWE